MWVLGKGLREKPKLWTSRKDTASNKKRRIIDVVRLVELLKVILNTGVEEMVNKYINFC